jgi:hypothetical protein
MGWRSVWWTLIVLAAAASMASAAPAAVRGRVSDPDGLPLPGVLVTVTSASNRQAVVATATTDAQGVFTFQLAPGTYKLAADLSGFDRAEQSLSVGGDAPPALDLRMHLASFQERVTVKADAPQTVLGDPVPAAPVTATREVVDSGMLPNSQYDDVLPLLPNVVRGPDGLISVAGASAPQGGLLVNGFNLADPLSGQAILLLPLEAIDSVEVFSGGYGAEAGRATGGVTSVHTRSGGSEWHASANSFFPRIRFIGGKAHGVDSWEPNAGFSGPLFGSRLLVEQAVSYRYDRNRAETLSGSQDSTYTAFMSWSQVDWRASDHHLVSATVSFDPQRTDPVGVTAFTSVGSAPEYLKGGWSAGLVDRFTIGENSAVETRFAAVRGRLVLTPTGVDPYLVGHDIVRGSYFDRRDLHGTRLDGSAAWSWTAPSRHQVQLGASVSSETTDGNEAAGVVQMLDSSGRLARRISFLPPSANVAVSSSHLGLFVQDRWTLSPRVTIDAGTRLDWSTSASMAFSPRVAWTVKLPWGDSTFGGSAGLFADKIPLEAYAFTAGQGRVVEEFDPSGTLVSSRLFGNVASGSFTPPTASRWDVELDHRFSGGWQARVKYQARHGQHELIVDPVDTSASSGSLLLQSSGASTARSVELTAAYKSTGSGHEVFISYVRASARGSVNTLADVEGAFREPYVQPDQTASLSSDVPDRLLAWGMIHLPARITVAPFLEVRSGFPFSPIDDVWRYAAPVNSARLPWFGSLDLYVNKVFTLSPRLPDARIGLKLYNVASVHTERDVQRDIARPDFGQTYNPIPRDFTLVFELLWGRK